MAISVSTVLVMTFKQTQMLKTYIADLIEIGDLRLSGISDRKLAERHGVAHIRSGEFAPSWGTHRSLYGTKILAAAHDPIYDVAQILTTDGRLLSA